MSNYGEYIQEREGKHIVEDERGFATYYFMNDSVYIENIFTGREHRQSGVAKEYADKIAVIAKEKGCKHMYGSVVPTAKQSTISLKVLLAYGMELDSSTNNFILMKKEI